MWELQQRLSAYVVSWDGGSKKQKSVPSQPPVQYSQMLYRALVMNLGITSKQQEDFVLHDIRATKLVRFTGGGSATVTNDLE